MSRKQGSSQGEAGQRGQSNQVNSKISNDGIIMKAIEAYEGRLTGVFDAERSPPDHFIVYDAVFLSDLCAAGFYDICQAIKDSSPEAFSIAEFSTIDTARPLDESATTYRTTNGSSPFKAHDSLNQSSLNDSRSVIDMRHTQGTDRATDEESTLAMAKPRSADVSGIDMLGVEYAKEEQHGSASRDQCEDVISVLQEFEEELERKLADVDADFDKEWAAIQQTYRQSVDEAQKLYEGDTIGLADSLERIELIRKAAKERALNKKLSRERSLQEAYERRKQSAINERVFKVSNNGNNNSSMAAAITTSSLQSQSQHVTLTTQADITKQNSTFSKVFSKWFSHTQRRIIEVDLSKSRPAQGYIKLRRYNFSLLDEQSEQYRGLLGTIKILPRQPLPEYLWCLELFARLCCELGTFRVTETSMTRLLRDGIKQDYRFKHITTMQRLMKLDTTSYSELKAHCMEIHRNSQTAQTSVRLMQDLAALQLQLTSSGRNGKNGASNNNNQGRNNNNSSSRGGETTVADINAVGNVKFYSDPNCCIMCGSKEHRLFECKCGTVEDRTAAFRAWRASGKGGAKKSHHKNSKQGTSGSSPATGQKPATSTSNQKVSSSTSLTVDSVHNGPRYKGKSDSPQLNHISVFRSNPDNGPPSFGPPPILVQDDDDSDGGVWVAGDLSMITAPAAGAGHDAQVATSKSINQPLRVSSAGDINMVRKVSNNDKTRVATQSPTHEEALHLLAQQPRLHDGELMRLLGDTAAQRHVFRVLPPTARNIRQVDRELSLGGTHHRVPVRLIFDCGLLTDVHLAPDIGHNLVSMTILPDLGIRQILYEDNRVEILRGADLFLIATGLIKDRFVIFDDDRLIRLTPNDLPPLQRGSPDTRIMHQDANHDDRTHAAGGPPPPHSLARTSKEPSADEKMGEPSSVSAVTTRAQTRARSEAVAPVAAPRPPTPPRRRVSFTIPADRESAVPPAQAARDDVEVTGEAPVRPIDPEPPPGDHSTAFHDDRSLQGVNDPTSSPSTPDFSDYESDEGSHADDSSIEGMEDSSSSPRSSPRTRARIAAGMRSSSPNKGRARTRPHALREDTNGLLLTLHRRFGHMPERKLRRFIKYKMAKGLPEYDEIKTLRMGHCVSCLLAKSTRLPSDKSDTDHEDLQPMQAVSADLVGKFRLFSTKGNRYVAIYVDHATGYIVTDCIKKKSDVLASIKRFVNNHVHFHGLETRQLHVDFDRSFRDKAVQEYLLEKGIKMTFSAPYHHQGNGRAERSVRKVLDLARTLMIEASAPLKLTEYYIEWATRMLNCTPNSKSKDKTPYEMVIGKQPDMSYCVPSNATAFVHIYDEEDQRKGAHKMHHKAQVCRVLGYPDDSEGSYMVLTNTGKVLYRRDVRIVDNPPLKVDIPDKIRKDEDIEKVKEKVPRGLHEEQWIHSLTSDGFGQDEFDANDEDVWLEDEDDAGDISMVEPLPSTPKNVDEALHSNNPHRELWRQAIIAEMDAIIALKTWEDVDPETAEKVRAFKSKFAFKIKREVDGKLKFKARLVVKGFLQVKGLDYDETYAPTICFHIILIVLHIAVTFGWHITGCDIGNAYLEALTNRELYMELPQDWIGRTATGKKLGRIVVRLLRNLYGSKQAALMWYNHLSAVLIEYGFKRLIHEPCCFVKELEDGNKIITCVYVDDILIVTTQRHLAEELKAYFLTKFENIKDLGDLKKYLGIWLTPHPNGKQLELSQQEYIEEILRDAGIAAGYGKESPLPLDIEEYLDLEGDGSPSLYDLLGKIRFLVDRTRQDLAYPASIMARFAAKPHSKHHSLMSRILRYLQFTKSESLLIGSQKDEVRLFGYADASFIRQRDSKGQLGYLLYLSEDSGAFLCKSKKDKSVSLSSFHVEVNALVECVKEVIFYRGVLEELGFKQTAPTTIYQDNMSVIYCAESIGRDKRSRYLIPLVNFVHEQIALQAIKLQHERSKQNVADLQTKSLVIDATETLRRRSLRGNAEA